MKQTSSFGASIFYMLYLFPTGLFGFIVTVTGLALSLGLIPIFIGFPLLLGCLYAVKWLTSLDARMARRLLAVDGASDHQAVRTEPYSNISGLWRRLSLQLSDQATYSALLWQVARLPVGILSFTLTVTVISVELALLLCPAVYWVLLQTIHIDIFDDGLISFLSPVNLTPMQISFLYMGIGLILFPVASKLIRTTAYLLGQLAIEMDSSKSLAVNRRHQETVS